MYHKFEFREFWPTNIWLILGTLPNPVAVQKRITLFFILFPLQFIFAQHLDLLIRGGRVIDPKNNINELLDVGVRNGRIVKLAKEISPAAADKVIDAGEMLVVPGLIDMHTHDFYGRDSTREYCNGNRSVRPDDWTFNNGITTTVDAGSSGWKDFAVFKDKVIDRSQTRILVFLNIVGAGMRGGRYEQDTFDMNAYQTARVAGEFRGEIVGIKCAHYRGRDWKALDEAVSAGRRANMPVMVDFGENKYPLSLRELFQEHLRPGDIYTHCFADLSGRDPLVDTVNGKLKAFVWQARERGIAFDVGYGEVSFALSQAVPASRDKFYPNSISSDMHACYKKKIEGLPEIMSEFLALGMPVPEIIKAVTWNPAQEVGHKELGNLSTGSFADITILELVSDKTVFYDHTGAKIDGAEKFICRTTIRNGRIVYQHH